MSKSKYLPELKDFIAICPKCGKKMICSPMGFTDKNKKIKTSLGIFRKCLSCGYQSGDEKINNI